MRTQTPLEAAVLASDDYYTQTRIGLGTDPATTVISPVAYLGYEPFRSAEIVADLENPLVTATLVFELGRGKQSLSPYMTGGMLVSGRPMFDAGRYLTIETRIVGRYPGAPPEASLPWRPVFTGRIDSADPDGSNSALTVHCRDLYADWMDRWIEPEPETGSYTIQGGAPLDVMTQLMTLFLDQWAGPIASGQPVLTQIGVPVLVSPTFRQEAGPGLLALRAFGLLAGWDLRGRWNAADQFVMTYYAPDRLGVGAGWIYGPGRQYSFNGLAKSRDDVRNRVRVTPADPPRTISYFNDQTSMDTYGWKFLGLAEDEASRIRTSAQADALAAAILSDVKEPKVSATIEANYQPLLEVNDLLMFGADGMHMDTDLIVAASGFRHSISVEGAATTTIATRDRPAAANDEWRRGGVQMLYSSVYPPTGIAAEGARWIQQLVVP